MKPIKGLGQNFLKDNRAIKRVIDGADLSEKDIVLEIGPGKGALTKELLKKAKKVIAIEKDRNLVKILREKFESSDNLEIIEKDILNYELGIMNYEYKIVANLPFYITGAIIRMFLEADNPPKQLTLIIQKEVAQRICDKKKSSILSLSVLFYANPKIISYISKRSFSPAPKVDSAIIQITPIKNKYKADPKKFFKIVKAGFSHPRKQLANNLSTELNIDKSKLEFLGKTRAEDLKIEDWINIVSSL